MPPNAVRDGVNSMILLSISISAIKSAFLSFGIARFMYAVMEMR
jgi:hypothetical protein